VAAASREHDMRDTVTTHAEFKLRKIREQAVTL
jgi:hypothetical protein